MESVQISNLKPFISRLAGGFLGEVHSGAVRERLESTPDLAFIVLDFAGVESASASYLKRVFNPFYATTEPEYRYPGEVCPIIVNIQSDDLHEELEDFFGGKNIAVVIGMEVEGSVRFKSLIGRLDGAAAETFKELQILKETTALELFEKHKGRTSNQTAWNNRLVQLTEMRLACRRREGRFWFYRPTIPS